MVHHVTRTGATGHFLYMVIVQCPKKEDPGLKIGFFRHSTMAKQSRLQLLFRRVSLDYGQPRPEILPRQFGHIHLGRRHRVHDSFIIFRHFPFYFFTLSNLAQIATRTFHCKNTLPFFISYSSSQVWPDLRIINKLSFEVDSGYFLMSQFLFYCDHMCVSGSFELFLARLWLVSSTPLARQRLGPSGQFCDRYKL